MFIPSEILAEYNLLPSQFEIIAFGNGLINTTWRIKNNEHDFILQKINKHVFKDPMAIAFNIDNITTYLNKNYPNYLFITTIKTKAGKEMAYVNEEYFRLTNYVQHSHTITTVTEAQQAFEAARMFGEFTKKLSGFNIDSLKITLPHFHDLSLRFRQFEEAIAHGNAERKRQSLLPINFIYEHKNIVDVYIKILNNPSFKLRVTHHDTKISNVLFDDDDKGLCVIDPDTIMPGYFISDVGDMLRTYLSPANEEEQDFSKIEIRDDYFFAIWKGYMSEMQNELTADEKEHFIYAGKFMIYMQALRFLTDHLNNDIYYGAKYPGHNFVRACNQLHLLKALLAKEERLMRLINAASPQPLSRMRGN